MGLYSILPAHFSSIESWLARIFLILGLVTITPWLLLLVYDLVLYIWREITYEVPYFGGRARGKERLRAPSLRDRNLGDKRKSEDVGSGTAEEYDVGRTSARDPADITKRVSGV